MSKLYNTQSDFTTGFKNFFANFHLRKTQLKIIPSILFGMILSESVSAPDIARVLKDEFSLIQYDSVVKRIRRFFNNTLFESYAFYEEFISYIIDNYKKKHLDKRVHIIFDHMFSHENYTVFMLTMRIGKQGIPVWFQCFKGISENKAFELETIKNAITKVSDLFKHKDLELIFLADRWFNSIDLLKPYLRTVF